MSVNVELVIAYLVTLAMLVGLVVMVRQRRGLIPLIVSAWDTMRDAVRRFLLGPDRPAPIEPPDPYPDFYSDSYARQWGEWRGAAAWATDNPDLTCRATTPDGIRCYLPAGHDGTTHRGRFRNGDGLSWDPVQMEQAERSAVPIQAVPHVAAIWPESSFRPEPRRPDCDDCEWTLIMSLQGPVTYVRSDTCERHRPEPYRMTRGLP